MELSQSRPRSALQYALELDKVSDYRRWLTGKLTANGLSSSRLRLNADGTENLRSSQRVEFRVRTNAEAKIGDILRVGQP
jgi:outer membrane protein OmpA-like peptidoglycan-associated protein